MSFFDDVVPSHKWACIRQGSGYSVCVDSHVNLLINSISKVPLMSSCTLILHTVAGEKVFTNVKIWELGLLHSGTFLQAKSH